MDDKPFCLATNDWMKEKDMNFSAQTDLRENFTEVVVKKKDRLSFGPKEQKLDNIAKLLDQKNDNENHRILVTGLLRLHSFQQKSKLFLPSNDPGFGIEQVSLH